MCLCKNLWVFIVVYCRLLFAIFGYYCLLLFIISNCCLLLIMVVYYCANERVYVFNSSISSVICISLIRWLILICPL